MFYIYIQGESIDKYLHIYSIYSGKVFIEYIYLPSGQRTHGKVLGAFGMKQRQHARMCRKHQLN